MINNVNRTFTITPLLVISGHLLNIFVLVDILAEGESFTSSVFAVLYEHNIILYRELVP